MEWVYQRLSWRQMFKRSNMWKKKWNSEEIVVKQGKEDVINYKKSFNISRRENNFHILTLHLDDFDCFLFQV